MIGKNYKIRSYKNLNITRNYTISNVMESTFYSLINKALQSNADINVNRSMSDSDLKNLLAHIKNN